MIGSQIPPISAKKLKNNGKIGEDQCQVHSSNPIKMLLSKWVNKFSLEVNNEMIDWVAKDKLKSTHYH